MSQIVEKCPFRNVEEFLKKFLDLDSDPDDFRNLISFSCPLIHLW